MSSQPSRKQIRKAASTIRKWWVLPYDRDERIPAEVLQAYGVLVDFRATFQRPLDKVTIQLRRFVSAHTDEVIVAQRLKRMPTILDKLERQPTMDITRMQDIGGCRAVLPSQEEIEAVLERIGRHCEVHKVYDYVNEPKPSGYRARHVVVVRNERMIEIQLRTVSQQRWGEAVERVGARLGLPVKDGVGPAFVLRFFELLGYLLALEERGDSADDQTVAELNQLSQQVRGILGRSG